MGYLLQLVAAAGVFAVIEWTEERIRRRYPGHSNLRYGLIKLVYGPLIVLAVFAPLLQGGVTLHWTAIAGGVLIAALLALIFFGDDE